MPQSHPSSPARRRLAAPSTSQTSRVKLGSKSGTRFSGGMAGAAARPSSRAAPERRQPCKWPMRSASRGSAVAQVPPTMRKATASGMAVLRGGGTAHAPSADAALISLDDIEQEPGRMRDGLALVGDAPGQHENQAADGVDLLLGIGRQQLYLQDRLEFLDRGARIGDQAAVRPLHDVR